MVAAGADRVRGETVVLDVDGTLVDSTYLHALAWARAFGRHGHQVPHWQVHRTIGLGGDKLVGALLGEEVERREGAELRSAWREAYDPLRPEAAPLPGAAELVRSLHDRGFTIVLASSGERDLVDEAVDRLRVRDCVDIVLSSEDVEESKPAPDLVRTALDRAGAARAVMVGDTVYDVEGAGRAGIGCVCLRTGGFAAAELEEAGALVVVDDPAAAVGLPWVSLLRAR